MATTLEASTAPVESIWRSYVMGFFAPAGGLECSTDRLGINGWM